MVGREKQTIREKERMSRLSSILHRYESSNVVQGVVRYLEHIDIPGNQRKILAMAVLRLLHVNIGGTWDSALENAISGAIEFVLSRVRDDAKGWDTDTTPIPSPAEPPAPPKVTSIYDTPTIGQLPSAADLIRMGFTTGDVAWTSKDGTQWQVTHPGGVLNADVWNLVGVIGGP